MRPDSEPVESPPDHPWVYLSHSEWKLCYAISFLASSTEYGESAYPLDRFTSEPFTSVLSDWGKLIDCAIRYVALDLGLLFSGLSVHPAGDIILEQVVAPGNSMHVMLAAAGKLPGNPRAAIQAALQFYEKGILPTLNPEPMRSALVEIEESLQAVREATPRENLEMEAELRTQARAEFWNEGRQLGWSKN